MWKQFQNLFENRSKVHVQEPVGFVDDKVL